MSFYIRNSSSLEPVLPNHEWWTKTYTPGAIVPVSGIYKCHACGREVTSNQGDPFPTQNHHQHSPGQGSIGWRLNIRTQTDPDK